MKKLKVAFLWHFHQPIYKKQNEFILPWVRLHGVKDYNDLPEIFYEFPNLKQTINIVPSLWRQIDEYVNIGTKDKIQVLSEKLPKDLDEKEKEELLHLFFLCNTDRMINPYPCYKHLLDKNNAGEQFTNQEILDLQVWYNLTWIGEFSRRDPAIRRLFVKGSNFSEVDKRFVLDYHLEILNKINKTLLRLVALGQAELTVSPLNHPILPLLCNSEAMHESLPKAMLPDNVFRFPQDAEMQVVQGRNYYAEYFGSQPNGMWPSEGSISNEVLEIIGKSGFKWTATDETVLKNSMKDEYRDVYKYFPIKYSRNGNNITLFFRDHGLSDAIGFQYAGWRAEDAAGDFCSRLCNIKKFIVSEMGEESLDQAVVSVILDGENCWEYYENNGIDFLRSLFGQLTKSADFDTVLFGDVYNNNNPKIPVLSEVQAGSWINGNFDIWMGHVEHRIAWSILTETRQLVENVKDKLDPETRKRLFDLIYIAESSDWFWWYGDQHIAPNKPDFDVLFRWYLTEIYKFIKLPVPEILNYPIGKSGNEEAYREPSEQLNIEFSDVLTDDNIWKNAALLLPDKNQSSMHRSGSLIKSINFGNDNKYFYTRIQLADNVADENFKINYTLKEAIQIEITKNSITTNSGDCSFARSNNSIFLSVSVGNLLSLNQIAVAVESEFSGNHIKYGTVNVKIMK